jgi:hypothetical protein
MFVFILPVTFAAYDIKLLVLKTEMKSVYCALQTGAFNRIVEALSLTLSVPN